MVASTGIVLYRYSPKNVWYLIPLFFVIGGLLLAIGIGLPLLMKPTAPGVLISAAFPVILGIALPVLSILIVLLVPAIITVLHPDRGVLELVYKRPLWRSSKAYNFVDIKGIRPIWAGENSLTLALILKSGKEIRIEHSSTSDREQVEKAAAEIDAQLKPYLQRTP